MSLTSHTGFDPIIGAEPKVLILGSMPGIASLVAGEYYAHPRNAFWKIITNIFQQPMPNCYKDKIAFIKIKGIALWDVIQTCKRKGSLDTAIEKEGMIENNIMQLLEKHPSIEKIGLNGGKAWDIFNKQYVKTNALGKQIQFEKLASTSPAYTKPFDEKLHHWQCFFNS